MGVRWTADRINRLRGCARDGLSFAEAGVWLGVSRNAVAGKANREGITFSGQPDHDKASRGAHKAWATKRRLARQAKA